MTTRDAFVAELCTRSVQPGNVQFWPGPDECSNPEGAVIVAAPDTRHPSWRVFVMDRGVRDERFFDDESSALEHVLARYFPSDPHRRG